MKLRNVTTRAQRLALLKLFARFRKAEYLWPNEGIDWHHRFSSRRDWQEYRAYRRRFQLSGFGDDNYLFGQPYEQGEGQLYVGIEPDGYTHS